MAKTKRTKNEVAHVLFGKENYIWMVAGLVILAIGFLLMAGGKSSDPNVFDKDSVYSPVRITIAPLLIIIGFCVEIFAIMRKPKPNTTAISATEK